VIERTCQMRRTLRCLVVCRALGARPAHGYIAGAAETSLPMAGFLTLLRFPVRPSPTEDSHLMEAHPVEPSGSGL
jgi:hypothetical protein